MHRQKHSEPSSVPLLEASLEHWIYLFVVHAVCVWHECRLKIISTINLGLIWRISSYHRPSFCRYFLIPPLTEISRRLKVKKKKFPTEKIPAKYNIYIYIYLTWRKFCFEFRFAIEFPLSRFFSSFPANWISENCLFQSIEFSHVTIQDERDEGEDEAWRYADSTKFETIFIFPPPFIWTSTFSLSTSWLDLRIVTTTESTLKSYLVRRKRRKGAWKEEGHNGAKKAAIVACNEKTAVEIHFERNI